MSSLQTFHASAERVTPAVLEKQVDYFAQMPLLCQALDATHAMIIILNQCRQVVFSNTAFKGLLQVPNDTSLIGKRPGEIIGCKHAADHTYGCGTAEACQECGTVNSILVAIDTGVESSSEVYNTMYIAGQELPLNALMKAMPLQSGEDTFYIVSFIDASEMVRKRVLEKIFFHDTLNTVGAITGIINLIKTDVPDNIQEDFNFIENCFLSLEEEILSQKQILEAENKDLVIEKSVLDSSELIRNIGKLYEAHPIAKGKVLVIADTCQSTRFNSDPRSLKRILGNMLKNAFEASDIGDKVTLGCRDDEDPYDTLTFWVHNVSYMPKTAQHHVFQRAFSTKGRGRGLGTYSMKLLGEKYLQGIVDFVTHETEGTTFYLTIKKT